MINQSTLYLTDLLFGVTPGEGCPRIYC